MNVLKSSQQMGGSTVKDFPTFDAHHLVPLYRSLYPVVGRCRDELPLKIGQ